MDRPTREPPQGLLAASVDRPSEHVEDAAQQLLADGHLDRSTGVEHRVAPDESACRRERDGPDRVAIEMTDDLQGDARSVDLQEMIDLRQRPIEPGVHHTAADARDAPAAVRDVGAEIGHDTHDDAPPPTWPGENDRVDARPRTRAGGSAHCRLRSMNRQLWCSSLGTSAPS